MDNIAPSSAGLPRSRGLQGLSTARWGFQGGLLSDARCGSRAPPSPRAAGGWAPVPRFHLARDASSKLARTSAFSLGVPLALRTISRSAAADGSSMLPRPPGVEGSRSKCSLLSADEDACDACDEETVIMLTPDACQQRRAPYLPQTSTIHLGVLEFCRVAPFIEYTIHETLLPWPPCTRP